MHRLLIGPGHLVNGILQPLKQEKSVGLSKRANFFAPNNELRHPGRFRKPTHRRIPCCRSATL